MFTLEHFLWLGICAIIIFLVVFLNKKFKFTVKQNITALFIISLICELFIIFSNMEYMDGGSFDTSGTYLPPNNLPFHLCGMQMLFSTLLMFVIKKENTRHALLCFMFPTTIIGAMFSLFIPTEGVDFANFRVYEYFFFHAYIIGFGIYLKACNVIEFRFKDYFRNMLIMFGLLVLALYINSMLSYASLNFMFLARPPMENLPVFNTDNGWYVYFLTLVGVAVFLLTAFQLPFAFIQYRKDKLAKSE